MSEAERSSAFSNCQSSDELEDLIAKRMTGLLENDFGYRLVDMEESKVNPVTFHLVYI